MPAVDEARQYRHYADRLMRGLRIQHERANGGGNPWASHDAELYSTLLANYSALLYRAGGRRTDEPDALHPDLESLSVELDTRFPRLRNFRNFLSHPPKPMLLDDEETWHLFSDGPMAALKDGGAEYIVDVEMDHDYVELVHRRFLRMLDDVIDWDAPNMPPVTGP